MAGFCVEPRPKALVSFYGYGDIVGAWYSRPDPFYSQQPVVPKEVAYQAVGDVALTGSPAEQRWRFYLYCRQQGRWPEEVTGHNPDQEPRWFERFCPIRNISQEYPPTLLLHGTADTDVPFEQSELMSRELERHGVEHKLMAMLGRGHGFDKAGAGLRDPETATTFDQILAFLKKHLMP
jgi:dipeptidyl aminopeptidase/acylaminoacyl peptidase